MPWGWRRKNFGEEINVSPPAFPGLEGDINPALKQAFLRGLSWEGPSSL